MVFAVDGFAAPPAEYLRCSVDEDPERRRRGRVRREQPDGGTFVDAAERRAEHLVPGTTAGPVDHERMNHGDDREARAGGGVANRGPATISEPAEDALSGQAQARTASVPAVSLTCPGGTWKMSISQAGSVWWRRFLPPRPHAGFLGQSMPVPRDYLRVAKRTA